VGWTWFKNSQKLYFIRVKTLILTSSTGFQ